MADAATTALSDSAKRIRDADDEALLAAEAFSFGLWDKYWTGRIAEITAKGADIERRINERFGTTGTGPSTWLADPDSLGEPVA